MNGGAIAATRMHKRGGGAGADGSGCDRDKQADDNFRKPLWFAVRRERDMAWELLAAGCDNLHTFIHTFIHSYIYTHTSYASTRITHTQNWQEAPI
jgi:hypothetical protein